MLSMPRIVRPDPHRFWRAKFGSPAGAATHLSIKRNKELRKCLCQWNRVNQNRELLLLAHCQ
jgi:hypothetical protein